MILKFRKVFIHVKKIRKLVSSNIKHFQEICIPNFLNIFFLLYSVSFCLLFMSCMTLRSLFDKLNIKSYFLLNVVLFQNTYRVLISPQPDQEENKLQRPNSNFCKPLQKKKYIYIYISEVCPSNQFSTAAMTSASDEKWQTFNCFFSLVGLRTYQHLCIAVTLKQTALLASLEFLRILSLSS